MLFKGAPFLTDKGARAQKICSGPQGRRVGDKIEQMQERLIFVGYNLNLNPVDVHARFRHRDQMVGSRPKSPAPRCRVRLGSQANGSRRLRLVRIGIDCGRFVVSGGRGCVVSLVIVRRGRRGVVVVSSRSRLALEWE